MVRPDDISPALDTENDKPTKKRDRDERPTVEPIPKREDFFLWLEKLFFDEPEAFQFPEKIEVRVVSGKHHERLGPMIKQLLFGPGQQQKPTRTKLVELSNEILHRVQRDCDIQRKQTVYGVHVAHFARETDFYERYLIRCNPSAVHASEGAPREGEEDDSQGGKFVNQVMSHHEKMFSLYGGAFEGLLDRMDRVLERQEGRIEKQDARIEKMSEVLEKALSLEAERAEKREWQQLKIKAAEKGLELGAALAPPLLNSLMAKKGESALAPTTAPGESLEALTLRNFFRKDTEGGMLTQEQANIAFGLYSEQPPHDLVKPGVLSMEQAKVLWDVAYGNASADALDSLLPGGPHAVTGEQLMALQSKCGFSMEQLAPLQMIFEARMKRVSTNK